MSVSLTLVPLALALRVVMGKKNFNNWVESQLVRVPVALKQEADILRTMRRAGYDTEYYGNSLKTHITESEFFFWDQRDGIWEAALSKDLFNTPLLRRFMNHVDQAAGIPVFVSPSQEKQVKFQAPPLSVSQPLTFPSNFRDRTLLWQTLQQLGVNPTQNNDNDIVCHVSGTTMTFRQTADAPFEVHIGNTPRLHEMFLYLSEADTMYKQGVQQMVYRHLKQRLDQEQLAIAEEKVLEDNSIVITLQIRE